MLTAIAVAHVTIGPTIFLVAQIPTAVQAATVGVWLFTVQHQFEDVCWAWRPAWEPLKAALEARS
jgi:omega-6 fatty acid desaturase (delta-12 desaturase)